MAEVRQAMRTPHVFRRVPAAMCLAVSLAMASVLPGCASWQTPQADALLAHPPAGMPAQMALSATPFVPQTDLQCGPAALAMVLGAAGVPASLDALGKEVFVPERGGSLQIEMLATPRRHGLVSTRIKPDMAALLNEVAAGHPAIVLLNLGLSIYPLWHYAVVIGYDLPARELIMHSGTTAMSRMPLSTFEHTWARSGQWAFVALPPGQLPASSGEADVVEALVAYERLNPPEAAAKAYQAALQRWPDDLVFALGLGNTLYASGQTRSAADVFEQAAHKHDSAAAWNNLANARLKLGEREAAVHAASQAVRRAKSVETRWLDAALSTLAEAQHASP
ncbi:MAG: PA2778 family cysteine peptidase [Aquabacterium sp.]